MLSAHIDHFRMYADSDGESHFQDLLFAFQAVDPTLGRTVPLASTEIIFNQVTASARLASWHHAPRRQYVIVLNGEFELEVSDGTVRRVHPGSIYLVEDLSGKGHCMRLPAQGEACIAFIPLQDQAPDH
jgi:hypothetical protein